MRRNCDRKSGQRRLSITSTNLFNEHPGKLHCKWGWGEWGGGGAGMGVTRVKVYITFFLFWLKIVDCRYSLEPPHRFGSKIRINKINYHLVNAGSRSMK